MKKGLIFFVFLIMSISLTFTSCGGESTETKEENNIISGENDSENDKFDNDKTITTDDEDDLPEKDVDYINDDDTSRIDKDQSATDEEAVKDDEDIFCGNGIIDGNELCDSSQIDCSLLSTKYESGIASCAENCLQYNVDSCIEKSENSEINIDEALSSISIDFIKEHVEWLSHDDRLGRFRHHEMETVLYLEDLFESLNLNPVDESFLQDCNLKDPWNNAYEAANVVGIIPGSDPELKDEVVIIGAHHDHLGTLFNGGNSFYKCKTSSDGGDVCNGADDNASGVSAVLSAAKSLATLKGKSKRTILFMTYASEELGLKGSTFYTDNPLFPIENTVYMINLDMIGYHSTNGLTIYDEDSLFMRTLLEQKLEKYISIDAEIDSGTSLKSDHTPFYEENIPTLLLSTMLHDCYHKTCDTAEKLDYDSMLEIIKMTTEILWTIAQDSDLSAK